MFKINKSGFTLVELLVVITILAIISVVAYQNYWWVTDKAYSWKKLSDIATIESALQQYKAENNYYPTAWEKWTWTDNLWWYDSWLNANKSNSIEVDNWWDNDIDSVVESWTIGWWRVMWKTWTPDWSWKQIWAKWTISQAVLWNKYLSRDLYDPEIWDIKVWNWKFIDYWVWRYIYWVFKKPLDSDTLWSNNKRWSYYNLAFTLKNVDTGEYSTKIVWDYDNNACWDRKDVCANTLIWSWDSTLSDGDKQTSSDTTAIDQWIPYALDEFTDVP